MSTAMTHYKDDAGLAIREMSFDMQKLGQFGLWVKAITQQVVTNTDDIEELKSTVKQQSREIAELKRKLSLMDVENAKISYPL